MKAADPADSPDYRPVRSETDSSATHVILRKPSPEDVFRRIMLPSHTNARSWFDGMIHVWFMSCSFSVWQTEVSRQTNDDLLFLSRQLRTYSTSHNYHPRSGRLHPAYGTKIASLRHHYGIIANIMATLCSGKWFLPPCLQQTIMESGSTGRICLTTPNMLKRA